MNIYFNDKLHQIASGTALQLVINNFIGEKQKGIAVAINDFVIPKQHWQTHLLQADDMVLVITATQGG